VSYETDKILERLSVPTHKLMRFLALSNPGVANRYNTLNSAEVGIIIIACENMRKNYSH
jgi:hypothetical protein